jgi:Tfp pilus assembly protein PilV
MFLMGLGFVGVFLALSQCFNFERYAREEVRATQIMQDKTETIRLYTWSQITDSAFLPSQFTESFCPTCPTNNRGVTYSGILAVTNAPVTEMYSNDLLQVTVRLTWTSGGTAHQSQINTLVSRYGLHNYIYSY